MQVGRILEVRLTHVQIESIALIIFCILIGSECWSVKFLSSEVISGAPENEPIVLAYIGVTVRDYEEQKGDQPRSKEGPEVSSWQ